MPNETGSLPLIQTKLYQPRVTRDLVPRPRLLERLERGRDRPLTLVVAPAGYGKSTLVASWLEACDCPSAWLSLDEDDNDLALFLSYFSAAIRTMFPEALGETLALLQVTKLPPLDVLARSLFGGAVLLAAGGAAYASVKLTQKDADRIEEYTGVPVEELSDEELQGAMDELGVQSMDMNEDDYAALGAEPGAEPTGPSYLEELEKLAALRDQGIITEDEFQAKKGQLLGL